MLYIDSLYRYAGEVLTAPTTVYVVDHHYDEENNVWPVQQLLDASKVDPHKHTLIFNFNIFIIVLIYFKRNIYDKIDFKNN